MVLILLSVLFSMSVLGSEAAAISSEPSIPAATQELNWYRDIQRKIFLESQIPSDVTGIGSQLNPEEMARQLKETGAQAVAVFAKDYFGNAYYPTRFPRVHPGLKFDMFGSMAKALHAQGLRVIAYFHIVGNPVVAEQHPDWQVLGEDGLPKMDGNQTTMSILSPYTEEVLLPQIKEILAYPVDGFFFDGSFISWNDHNPFACAKFKAETGRDMPPGDKDPYWMEYAQWLRKEEEAFRQKVCETIHSISPEVGVTSNVSYTNFKAGDPPQKGITHLTLDIFGLPAISELRRFTAFDLPYDMMFTRMTGNWYDWAIRPVTDTLLWSATNLANGGQLYLSDMIYPWGALEPEELRLAREVFHHAEAIEPWCTGTVPANETAILYTEGTYSVKSGGIRGYLNSEVLGCLCALIENHEYATILTEASLVKQLDQLKVIILPDQCQLTDSTIALLDAFVLRGGALLATGRTSLYGALGKIQSGFGLEQVLGVKYKSDFIQKDSYILVNDLTMKKGLPALPIQVHGRPPVVEATTATPLATLMEPWNPGSFYHYCPHAGPQVPGPPWKETSSPAITLNHYGKGLAAYLAPPLFEDYYEYENWLASPILENLLRIMNPNPRILADLPPSAEVTLRSKANQLLLHVVNWPSLAKKTTLIQAVPRLAPVEIAVRLDAPPVSVVIEPDGSTLPTRWESPYVRFTLPEVGIHTLVRIQVR